MLEMRVIIVASLVSSAVSPATGRGAKQLSTEPSSKPSSSSLQANFRWNYTTPVSQYGSIHVARNKMSELLSASNNSSTCDRTGADAAKNAAVRRSNLPSESSPRAVNVAPVVSPSNSVSGTEIDDETVDTDAKKGDSSMDPVNLDSSNDGRENSERPSGSDFRNKFLESEVTEDKKTNISSALTSKEVH